MFQTNTPNVAQTARSVRPSTSRRHGFDGDLLANTVQKLIRDEAIPPSDRANSIDRGWDPSGEAGSAMRETFPLGNGVFDRRYREPSKKEWNKETFGRRKAPKSANSMSKFAPGV